MGRALPRFLGFLPLMAGAACTRQVGEPRASHDAGAPGAPTVATETSRLGELYWVAGQVALEKGKATEAGEFLQSALQYFDAEKKDPPAGLLCDAGAALRRKGGDGKAMEMAARYLHRCLLAAPPGTPEHRAALRELVELLPLGLDPAKIARDTVADGYLTKTVVFSAERLKISVARTTPATDKGYEGWAKVIERESTRSVLLKCMGEYADRTHQTRLVVVLPLKLRARTGDDDLYVGGTLELQADPAATGPDAAAGQCLRDGLAAQAVEFAKSGSVGSWTGTLTVTLSIEQ